MGVSQRVEIMYFSYF